MEEKVVLIQIVDRNPSMTPTAPAKAKPAERVKLRQAETILMMGRTNTFSLRS